MNILEVNSILQTDSVPPPNLHEQYSVEKINAIQNEWTDVNTSLNLDEHIQTNFIRFRLAQGHNVPDYIPGPFLGDYYNFMRFTRTCFNTYLNNATLAVNISPVLLLFNAETQEYHVLYASHNFHFFPNARQIHNANTKALFFADLAMFNLQEQLLAAHQSLSSKYENCEITILSLFLSITRLPNLAYGYDGVAKCCSALPKSITGSNTCIFKALSVCLNGDGTRKKPRKNSAKTRAQPNQRVAKKLQRVFFFWLRTKKAIDPNTIFGKYGILDKGLHLLEQFIQCGVNIWFRIAANVLTTRGCKIVPQKRVVMTAVPLRQASGYISVINLSARHTQTPSAMHVDYISGLDTYFKKFQCHNCNSRHGTLPHLQRHLKAKVCQKQKVLSLSGKVQLAPINVSALAKQATKTHLNESSSFILFALKQNQNKTFNSTLTVNKDDVVEHHSARVHSTLPQMVIFLLQFLCTICSDKAQKLSNNLTFLAQLQTLLTDSENLYSSCKNSVMNLEFARYNSLSKLKDFAINFISHTRIFILTESSQFQLGYKFLKALLGVALSTFPNEKVSFECDKSLVSQVYLTGKKTGFHFCLVNAFFSDFYVNPNESPINSFCRFLSLTQILKKEFVIDVLAGQIISATQIGKIFFLQGQNSFAQYSLVSPPQALYKDVEEAARFGFIFATPCVIHPNNPTNSFKTYIAYDMVKFYTAIAKWSKLALGTPLQFKKVGNFYKLINKKLAPHAFANMLFATLQNLCEGSFHFQLLGSEIRCKNFPLDCVIQVSNGNKDHQPSLYCVSYLGCFFHACPSETHNFKSHPKNICNCGICTENRSNSGTSALRPALWQRPAGQTMHSLHPFKKQSYDLINQKTEEILKKVADSPLFKKVIAITECQIINFWSKSTYEFLKHFELPAPKPTIDLTLPFKSYFNQTVKKAFPLVKQGKISFTYTALLKAIKSDSITAFLKVKGCSKSAEKLFGKFRIFSIKKDNKIFDTNSIDNALVTSHFLSPLINGQLSQLAFHLEDITSLYLYPQNDKPTLQHQCTKLFSLMNIYSENKDFLKLLKRISNHLVGSFGYNPNKYLNRTILQTKDLYTLNLTRFVSAEPLTPNHSLASFNNQRKYANTIHNNLLIVQQGRAVMLQFLYGISKYTDASIVSCNTDGVLLGCQVEFPSELTAQNAPLWALDVWLKPNLSLAELQQYVKFKMQFFNVNVCEQHQMDYILCLSAKKLFKPLECCNISLAKNEIKYSAKLENIGQHAIILGKNKSLTVNMFSGATKIKFSGVQQATVNRFLSACPKEIAQIFAELMDQHNLNLSQ